MKNLKSRVFQSLANHPRSLVSGIANLLNEPNKDVRVAIRELRNEGIIDRRRKIIKPMFTQLELYVKD